MTDLREALDRLVSAEMVEAGGDGRRLLDLANNLLDGAAIVLAKASGGDRQSAKHLLDAATIRLTETATEHVGVVAEARRGGRP